ncbi:hypothetical protein GS531_00375 [Rhodococcus hoagii]|nr:hypothetical protein [Prescottella equi]
MSTTYTSGSTTIDKDRISGLAEDLESHRATRAHRWGDGNSDRRVCCPLTIAGYILETAGGVASFNMNSYSCTGEFSVTDLNDNALTLYVHVDDETLWNRVDEGAPDPWESLVEILAAHGARGEFNRGNDDGGWRVRIEGGVHRERRIDDLYEGDVVTWRASSRPWTMAWTRSRLRTGRRMPSAPSLCLPARIIRSSSTLGASRRAGLPRAWMTTPFLPSGRG